MRCASINNKVNVLPGASSPARSSTKTWHLSAYWGIHNSTHTDLVTATAAVVQWNVAINKLTSPLHIVGPWNGSRTKFVTGKTEKSESFHRRNIISLRRVRIFLKEKSVYSASAKKCLCAGEKKKDLGSTLFTGSTCDATHRWLMHHL